MNVASLELCKELYELSGWKDSRDEMKWWNCSLDKPAELHGVGQEFSWYLQDGEGFGAKCPAYDLGYLLRKLAQFLTIDHHDCRIEICPGGYGRKYKTPGYKPKHPHVSFWCAGYSDIEGSPYILETANTPEDAACKLAIELFKEGALTRD